MTHQFLLHLHRSTSFVKPGPIGVAESMPTNVLSQLGRFRGAFDL